MRGCERIPALALAVFMLAGTRVWGQKPAGLTEEEEDQLREAQDPGQRIEVYLALEQARLDQFDEFRKRPVDARYDNGAYLDQLLGQYIALQDEMKNWIDDQYERRGDMRKGLRALLEQGPRQLERLRQIQQSPDPYVADYRDSLRDARDDLSDALDGATKALAEQEKRFAEFKRQEQAETRSLKETTKEEKKREKEEKKLRKKQHKRGVPEDTEQAD